MISSTHFNNTINDIATGLSLCLTKDGQQTATANIPFGGFRATNVGITAIAGSVGTPAINVSDAGTGLYRSAASELAVTVAGSQVARFASTGLIITGAASVSTTLTATTSVVTPLVQSPFATALDITVGGERTWRFDTNASTGNSLIPTQDNTQSIGKPTGRVASIFTPILDSGTTGSLSLKTNNGATQFGISHSANAVNFFSAQGSASGAAAAQLIAGGTDTNISAYWDSKGTGSHNFRTASGANLQFQVLDTAVSNRNITVTGSNGGNPTLSTTAGSLAITPSVVMASTLIVSGASLSLGTTPALATGFNLPYASTLASRNNANSGDIFLAFATTVNAVADVVKVGTNSVGTIVQGRSFNGGPNTTDLPAGFFTVWRDTGGATTKLYYNNAGAIQSVALA